LHLVKVFLSEEARIGEQAFINRPKLDDSELCVADPSPAESGTWPGISQQSQNLLEHMIPEFDATQSRCLIFIEEITLQRMQLELVDMTSASSTIAVRSGSPCLHGHLTFGGKPRVDQLKKLANRPVEEVSIPTLLAIERYQSEITQTFEAVTSPILFAI